MKTLRILAVPLLLVLFPSTALAGHEKHHSYKEEYWDGNCKVKREMKKNGEYKEERKCEPAVVMQPAQAQIIVPAPAIVIQPAVRVQIGR